MSKKINVKKTYLCKFSDEKSYFIHMRCMVLPDSWGGDDGTELRRKMYTAYHLMDLNYIIKNDDGYVPGSFLDFIEGLDNEALKYIEWTEITD